jgi:hypothetical protein
LNDISSAKEKAGISAKKEEVYYSSLGVSF